MQLRPIMLQNINYLLIRNYTIDKLLAAVLSEVLLRLCIKAYSH